MKKILAVLTAAFLLMALAACSLGGGEPSAADPSQSSPGTEKPSKDWAVGVPVKKTDTKGWVLRNNLTVNNIDVSEGDTRYGSLIQIEGLKDKTLQDQINAAIENRFYELYNSTELPPYLGSKLMQQRVDRGDFESHYNSCFCSNHANFGNILSIEFYKNTNYRSGDEYLNVSMADVMNIDLRTGKEIKLADLFTDNTDGITYINNKIKNSILENDSYDELGDLYTWYDNGFRTAGEFTGIKEDQKYYISGDTGDIILILDYETPWVYTQSTPQYLVISMDGVSACTDRFASESSLYVSDVPDPYLFQSMKDDRKQKSEYENSSYDFNGGSGYIGYSYEYYEDLPWAQMQLVKPDHYKKTQLEGRFKQLCDTYSRYYSNNLGADMYYSSYCFGYAQYTNISSSYSMNFYTKNPWSQITSEGSQDYYVFKGKSSEPMALDDVFVPGSDVRALLKKAFEANALNNEYGWDSVQSQSTPEIRDAFYDAVIDHGLQFTIGSDRLSFYLHQGIIDLLIHQNIGEVENTYFFSYLIQSARYIDLGMENLSIFQLKP